MRALQKDPAFRFADAEEFIVALEQARGIPPGTGEYTRIAPHTGTYPGLPGAVAELERADRRNLRWLWWLLLLLALIGIAIGAYVLLMPEKLAVPDVVGRRSATAAQILQNQGFEVNVENVRSDDVPADRVTTQRPQPRQQAEEGSTVTIIVSSGPGDATIPFVRGSSQGEATKKLKAAGFKVDVRKEYNDDVAKGKVIETSPAEGQQLTRGTSVTLVVSRGPRQVEVPDVVGQEPRRRRGAARGPRAARSPSPSARTRTRTPARCSRCRRRPARRWRRAPRSTWSSPRSRSRSTVPDVVGDGTTTVNDAVDALEQAGFRVRQKEKKVDTPDEDSLVISQDPPGGEKRDKGSRVTITVGRFEPENLDPDPSATATPSPTP